MKGIIENFKDLSDSRELMEAKPRPFGIYFIYIVLGMLLLSILWASLGEMDVVVKASGVVRPNGGVGTLTSAISGRLVSVSKQNGDGVVKGEKLFALESSGIEKQLKNLDSEIALVAQTVNQISTLITSVETGQNLFDLASDPEGYRMYAQYEMDLIKSTEMIAHYEDQIKSLNEDVAGYTALHKAVEQDKSSCLAKEVYIRRLDDYHFQLNTLTVKRDQDKARFESGKALYTENAISRSDFETLEQAYLASTRAIDQYKNETLVAYEDKVKESEEQLQSVQTNLMQIKPESQMDYTESYFESTELAEMTADLKQAKAEQEALYVQKKQLELELAKCSICSPFDGVLTMDRIFVSGDELSAGVKLGVVIPKDNALKVQLYLPNRSVSQVEEGSEVKLKIDALPYKEYGLLRGRILHINADSSFDEATGISYYLVDVVLDQNSLISYTGKKASIKPGMSLEGQVVSERKRIIVFLLEQIDFWS